ncbi:MAG: CBS domain-containing protein [Hyphomicrobium sp.]
MHVAELLKVKGFAAVTIKAEATIADLANLLRQNRIGAAVVSGDGVTVDGIISERDIAYGLAEHGAALSGLPVSRLMTRNVVTCKSQDTIAEIARIMTWRGIRHLPVVDDGKLAGIISIRDVLRNRVADLHRLSDLLREYIVATE